MFKISLSVRLFGICGILLFLVACNQQPKNDDIYSVEEAKDVLNHAVEQYKGMMQTLPDSVLPRTFEQGKLVTSGTGWWCSGFYPGTLWYLYDFANDTMLKTEAIERTELLEKEQYNIWTHDLGFMLNCSFGNATKSGYKQDEYQKILIQGAKSLISRYDSTVGLIRSWDHGKWQYPVIIDNMMNLEYLTDVTQITGDSTYAKIAIQHADKTIEEHFREDYSTYHLVDFDTITGESIGKMTVQGYADESSWARGQAWGFYGYTMMYRETRKERYLDQAEKIAQFLLNHPNLPSDMVPYWDFNAPDIPDSKRDASAAAIIASGLLELYSITEKSEYLKAAEKMLSTLSSDKYLAEKGSNGSFLLKHSVGHFTANSEVDVPLTYADYYFVEALIRYINIEEKNDPKI